jgi:membrane protein implicated in regulation of membrane protease activity
MREEPTPARHDPDEVPHVVIALVILLALAIAATLLMVVSGHVPRHPGATLVAFVGVPLLASIAIMLARRWRRSAPR